MNPLKFFTFIAIFLVQAALGAPAALSELQHGNGTQHAELQARNHNDDCVEWEDEEGIWPW